MTKLQTRTRDHSLSTGRKLLGSTNLMQRGNKLGAVPLWAEKTSRKEERPCAHLLGSDITYRHSAGIPQTKEVHTNSESTSLAGPSPYPAGTYIDSPHLAQTDEDSGLTSHQPFNTSVEYSLAQVISDAKPPHQAMRTTAPRSTMVSRAHMPCA